MFTLMTLSRQLCLLTMSPNFIQRLSSLGDQLIVDVYRKYPVLVIYLDAILRVFKRRPGATSLDFQVGKYFGSFPDWKRDNNLRRCLG